MNKYIFFLYILLVPYSTFSTLTQDYTIVTRSLGDKQLRDDVSFVGSVLNGISRAIKLSKTECQKKFDRDIDPINTSLLPELTKVAESLCSIPKIDKFKVAAKVKILKAMFDRAKYDLESSLNMTIASANASEFNIASIGYR